MYVVLNIADRSSVVVFITASSFLGQKSAQLLYSNDDNGAIRVGGKSHLTGSPEEEPSWILLDRTVAGRTRPVGEYTHYTQTVYRRDSRFGV